MGGAGDYGGRLASWILSVRISKKFTTPTLWGLVAPMSYNNPYNTEIFFYQPWRPKGFQFEVIKNVLVSSFHFI